MITFMALDCGQGIGGVYIGLYFDEISTSEGWRREKKRKIFAASAAVDGIGEAGGRPWRRERRRRGVAVLVGRLVHSKSKIKCAPLSMVLFYRHSKLFCTACGFAPAARVPSVPGEGRQEGSQAGGLAGLYPPLHSYGWDDKWV